MKKKHVIVGCLLVIGAIMVGSSLAWWTWTTSSNEQTNVIVTVGGITIDYEDGENITNNNLIPTSTKEKGISKDITVSSTGQVYLDLNMEVVTLDDGLKDASFKYEIYNDNELIKGGNFANSNVGDNIELLGGITVTSTPTTYTLYIWIDGNMPNPNTMYNQNFEFRLNADATDEKSASKQTLEKLGLTSNGEMNSVTAVATTNEGIYETQDDYGTTYFFRGDVDNNYVEFAGYYWRVVRINGDGSIRMIYDGTSAHANGESSTDRQIGTSVFNYTYGDNAYVGYMMGIDNQCTSESCEGTINTTSYEQATTNTYNSTIKTYIDSWYETNIEEAGYSDKVADVIYCNDREVDEAKSEGFQINNNSEYGDPITGVYGYGENNTIYGASGRILDENGWNYVETNQIKMTCSQKNDAFTVNDTTNGNGALTYPVGLITLDELLAAGAYVYNWPSNYDFYLYTGSYYWTMSPGKFRGGRAYVWSLSYAGTLVNYLVNDRVISALGVRPVVSLRSDVQLSGSGTMSDPWTLN